MPRKVLVLVGVSIMCLNAVALAATGPAPAEIVQAFNRSISERQLDTALKLLAPGSVQFTLRSPHAELGSGAPQLTSDLLTHWRTIAPVVMSATSSYQRVPKVIDTHVDGDLATVWVTISSVTTDRNGKSRQAKFSEVYLLVHNDAGWQIASMGDNRSSTGLSDTAAPAAR